MSKVLGAGLLVVALAVGTRSLAERETDPFRHLVRKIPLAELGPIRSVRQRRANDDRDPAQRKQITVTISTTPAGARVYHGRRLLGVTPLVLRAPEDSTPLDLVIRARGSMTLRTRIARDVKRSYAFKLTPSKMR